MMLSKGGLRIYLCPKCDSTDIEKTLSRSGVRFYCNSCDTYGPWRTRNSESCLNKRETTNDDVHTFDDLTAVAEQANDAGEEPCVAIGYKLNEEG